MEMQIPAVIAEIQSSVESYCQQVCGGGECGPAAGLLACQYGIDSRTEMPLYDAYASGVLRGRVHLYDGIEVRGVREIETDGGADDDRADCIVDDENPQFYSVYVHQVAGGVDCVGDFGLPDFAAGYAASLASTYGWPVFNYVQ